MPVQAARAAARRAVPFPAAPPPTSAAEARVIELLARYPNVSHLEAAEILTFVKRARAVEVGRLATDDNVRRQLDMFVRGHRHGLRATAADLVSVACLVIAFLATCWLLWHAVAIGPPA